MRTREETVASQVKTALRRKKELKDRWRKTKADKKKSRQNYKLAKKYNISEDEYTTLLRAQKGCCAICRTPSKSKRRLAVDHNHQTDAVRGLLCAKCNLLLGYAGDHARVLKNAIAYLEKDCLALLL